MRSASSTALCALLPFLCSVGCSGDSSSSSSDPEQLKTPLKGSSVSKASELVGVWFALTDADFPSIEFMKDGKAFFGDGSTGMTADYTVLEGGRLSLAMQGGATAVFDVTLAGDQLELKGKASLLSQGGAQRFRLLAKGETVADAAKKERERKAKAYQERIAGLEAFLKQPDLVLAVQDGGAGAPPAIALELATVTASAFSGKAWHDDRPPHLDAISGQVLLDERAATSQVTVQFGPRIQPPSPNAQGGGQVTLNATGSGKDLSIAGKVTYGQGAASYNMALKSDSKLHADVVSRFDAEIARIAALRTPMVNLLKEFTIIRGQLPAPVPNQPPESVEIALARDAKTGQYRCESLSIGARGRGDLVPTGAAEIVVMNDRPLLRVVCPPAREYLLNIADEKSGKLSGQWQSLGQPQGTGAQLDVVTALDASARDARFEAQRTALKSIGAEAVFTGLAFEDSGFGLEMPISFRLQISIKPDGAVAGKAEYPTMATVANVAGQLAETAFGPRLQLSYTGADATAPDQIFFRSIQRGAWTLSPGEGSGPMKLVGYFNGPPVRKTSLTQWNDESKSQIRKKVQDALRDDGRFYLARCTGWQTPGQNPTVIEWKLDEASGKVTGKILTGGRPLGAYEGATNTYAGELKEDKGWVLLSLVQDSVLKANDKFVTAFELLASEDASGALYLSGNPTSIGRVQNEKRVSEAPPKKDYPVGFIPVAATDVAARASIDKAFADKSKAQEAAASKLEADQKAADDARRARFAPFAPTFQSKSGAVLTTDLGPEFSLLILESTADLEKSTVSGSGTNLREMPFKDFTFTGSLDARGQLTLTTTLAPTPYVFNSATDKGLAYGRTTALTLLTADQRTKLGSLVDLGKKLGGAPPRTLAVETLNAATAKTREASLQASNIPGVAIFQKRKNDAIAAMFTVQSNGKFRWAKEPMSLRLDAPLKGTGLYVKGGLAPTDNLVVVINGVHTATIAAIERLGAAVVALPPDLEILDINLKAEGTAQVRGVVLLK